MRIYNRVLPCYISPALRLPEWKNELETVVFAPGLSAGGNLLIETYDLSTLNK